MPAFPKSSPTRPRVLVLDADPPQLDSICRGLHLYGYHCEGVPSVEAALQALFAPRARDFDLVLTDLTLLGPAGLALIERLQRQRPDLPIVIITGLAYSPEQGLVRDQKLPSLRKPYDPEALDATLRRVLGRRPREGQPPGQ